MVLKNPEEFEREFRNQFLTEYERLKPKFIDLKPSTYKKIFFVRSKKVPFETILNNFSQRFINYRMISKDKTYADGSKENVFNYIHRIAAYEDEKGIFGYGETIMIESKYHKQLSIYEFLTTDKKKTNENLQWLDFIIQNKNPDPRKSYAEYLMKVYLKKEYAVDFFGKRYHAENIFENKDK